MRLKKKEILVVEGKLQESETTKTLEDFLDGDDLKKFENFDAACNHYQFGDNQTGQLERLDEFKKYLNTRNKDKIFYFIIKRDMILRACKIIQSFNEQTTTSFLRSKTYVCVLDTFAQDLKYPRRSNLYHLMNNYKDLTKYNLPCLRLDGLPETIKDAKVIIPVILKPNGVLKSPLFFELLKHNNIKMVDLKVFNFNDAYIKLFYKNVHNFHFGDDWYAYLKSGSSALVILTAPHYQHVRDLAILYRQKSGIPFTRNVIHSAENDAELAELNLFKRQLEIDYKFKFIKM